jgi:hypothetical protein
VTFTSIPHLLQRSWELGFWGTLRRAWLRTGRTLSVRSQSWWWKRKASRGTSDAALLALTSGEWSSVDALLEHLATRPGSSFLLPHDSANHAAAILQRRYPEYASALVDAADACCRNELSLGGQNFSFAEGIDWHTDPVTGRRWPLLYWKRLDQYLWSESAADSLFVWELNRHQHFVALGIAFWLTKDDRYVAAFECQIQSWVKSNPLRHGINWRDGLEIAIRLISWTVAFQFFRSSSRFREETGKIFLKSLWQQADFLSSHLQTTTMPGAVPNNHLIGELTALVLVGAAFPEFRMAAVWRDTALHLLNQEVKAQTHSDGTNKEQATVYHRFVAELLLLIVTRSRQSALPAVPILEHILEGMLEYVAGTVTPSGTVPMWGDSASIRVLGMGHNKDFWDFRPILSAGAALFGRPDWKYVAERFDEAALLLLGAVGLDRWEQLEAAPPKWTSREFPDGGQYVIRDSWSGDTDVAFFRCGPFGLGGEGHCAHAHCDLLSFLLYMRGEPVLVDSGTYTYHGPWRDRFRLTEAHNTVMIDGHDQAVPLHNFSWKHVPEAKCIDWTGERVRGVLADFGKVEFSREILHPRQGIWHLIDTFTGRGEHMMEWFFHFAPGLELDLYEAGQTATVLKDGRPFLTVHIPDGGIRPRLRDSWYSHQYGIKQLNRELYAQWQGELGTSGMSFHWQFKLVEKILSPAGD